MSVFEPYNNDFLILRCIDLLAASSQFSFYYKTGGEIRWDAAKSVGGSRQGMKMFLSGLVPTTAAAMIILTASWFATPGIYILMTRWLRSLSNFSWLPNNQLPGGHKSSVSKLARVWTLRVGVLVAVLWIFRPGVPYRHMSGALPFVMLGPFGESSRGPSIGKLWENNHHDPISGRVRYGEDGPAWAREPLPPGFERWALRYQSNSTGPGANGNDTETDEKAKFNSNYYDPAKDPMKISNLDLELMRPLQTALQDHDVPVTHIVLVFLESGRKDLFPFKSDSRLHKQIYESYHDHDADSDADINQKLSSLTAVAERLTGERSGFNQSQDTRFRPHSPGSELGGISVDGALSGSSLSSKARLVNYCGVGPLPVDFMPETSLMPYQPCLMHIMELFNRRKQTSNSTNNHENSTLDRQWHSIYAQSVTGGFKDQTKLVKLMGFDESLYSEDIERPRAKYYHSGMENINYFG